MLQVKQRKRVEEEALIVRPIKSVVSSDKHARLPSPFVASCEIGVVVQVVEEAKSDVSLFSQCLVECALMSSCSCK